LQDFRLADRYELELGGQKEGLQLSMDRVTIRRGETVVATIRRKTKVAVPVVAAHPPPPALQHAIPWQDEEQRVSANICMTDISSDGQLFLGAGDAGPSGHFRVFDLATGKLVRELVPEGEVWFSFARFLPGSKYLAANYSREKDLYLWDITTGKVVRKFIGHTDIPSPPLRMAGSHS
jgi:WD40 repeat protein